MPKKTTGEAFEQVARAYGVKVDGDGKQDPRELAALQKALARADRDNDTENRVNLNDGASRREISMMWYELDEKDSVPGNGKGSGNSTRVRRTDNPTTSGGGGDVENSILNVKNQRVKADSQEFNVGDFVTPSKLPFGIGEGNGNGGKTNGKKTGVFREGW